MLVQQITFSLSSLLPESKTDVFIILYRAIDRESNKANFHPLGENWVIQFQLWSGSDMKEKSGGGQRLLADCSLLTDKEKDMGAGK